MKITLAVLFLAGLTIYCKCAAVLSLPPSLIAHAASLDESLKTPKPSLAKHNETLPQQQQANEDEDSNVAALAADLYTNFKNLWHNNDALSLNLKKRERNTFDDDIYDVAARQKQHQYQQIMAAIKKNNQNQNGLKPHDNDNVGHNKNYNNNNHNNNNHKNKNNILKSSLPLLLSSAATNMNEDTNLQFPSQKFNSAIEYDDTNEWLSPSSEMIDDIFVSPPRVEKQQPPPTHLKRRELENMPAPAKDSTILNRLFRPSRYWSRQCPLENENNCLQRYYGALIADRNNALLKQLQYQQKHPFSAVDVSSQNHNNNINNNDDDDILLLLTAEQNLIKFLSWALGELYPYGKFTNATDTGADSYDPGMYMWKKLNLSGRLEPPLLVDEPRYVIVRREYDQSNDDETDYKRGLSYGGDPFIPPRGRKHNLPDLDSLLHRYETFVPNRGRRDKIKDIFKYDDLFYPNRGKRQMTIAGNDNGVIDERNDDANDSEAIDDDEKTNEQHPLLSNELTEYIEELMAKMKRKLQPPNQQQPDDDDDDDEQLANSFDEMSNINEPTTRMSTRFQQAPPPASVATTASASPSPSPSLLEKRFKSMINILQNHKQQQQQRHQQQHLPNHYNARRQWWKRYTTKAKTSSTRPTNSNVTNRLQTTLRSVSPLQQLTQLYQQKQQQQQAQQHADLSPPYMKPASKFMWQQQKNSLKSLAQQFDPLSWHKLQLLLQQHQQYHHRHHEPLLTMRHPRVTALQHLPAIQQLATPQETQLTYSNDQIDNSITNNLDHFYNKDLD